MLPMSATRHYPEVDRPVIAVGKSFAAGSRTGRHSHVRAQLIHAIEGLMVAETALGTWVVPKGYALWVPPTVEHDVAMRGAVAMRTAYVAADAVPGLPRDCRVLPVTPLLAAALVALAAEQPAWNAEGRGGHLAALVLDEVVRASPTRFALPVPADPRLARLARALIADPASSLGLDGWAARIGASRRTLTRRFRAETGMSFATWRRRLRLLEAVARQAEGERVERLAPALGYRSAAAFRAMARRELGLAFDQR